ncbi:MAG: hydroxymethylbilane synthase [Alphaproteobacteria bacterium]
MQRPDKPIRLGTRGSPLALKQADMVMQAIQSAAPDQAIEIVIIKTSGDWRPEQGETRLSAAQGGKGLFAKELEAALFREEIDIAVHSMKDMDSNLPEGLSIPWMLPRADARDALICANNNNALADNGQTKNNAPDLFLPELPHGCTIGTASVRRAAFLKSRRPDIQITPLRGNVQTRLDKIAAKQVEASFLAMAGLERLELTHHVTRILEPDDMLPAAGQGSVGIEILNKNHEALAFIGQISCSKTMLCVSAEREALRVLDGSCHTPIGAYATLQSDQMHLRVQLCTPESFETYSFEETRKITDIKGAVQFGADAANHIKSLQS